MDASVAALPLDVIFNGFLTVITAVMGWGMKQLVARIENLERTQEQHQAHVDTKVQSTQQSVVTLDKEFAAYREFIARSYPTREETNNNFREVKLQLDKILDRLEAKVDKP